MAGTKQKHSTAVAAHERIGETVNKGVKEVRKAAVGEATESGKTFLRQLLGLEIGGKSKSKSKDHHAEAPAEKKTTSGIEVIDIFVASFAKSEKSASHESQEKPKPRVEAAMNYSGEIARSSERAVKSENHELNQQIQEIKAELNQLLSSSKVLSMEFAEMAMEQPSVEGGKYHVTFLDWMLIVIRQARQKVEDSGAWLNVMKGKGKGKGKTDYSIANGQMHQSGERTTVQNAVG